MYHLFTLSIFKSDDVSTVRRGKFWKKETVLQSKSRVVKDLFFVSARPHPGNLSVVCDFAADVVHEAGQGLRTNILLWLGRLKYVR